MTGIGKLQLTSGNQLLQKFKRNIQFKNDEEPTMLKLNDGIDTVTFTPKSATSTPTKSYVDILEEFNNVYGEGRSLEQAKLGIEYMDKLLACEDLPANRRADIEVEKQGYEMMLVEFENFISKYKKDPENASYHAGTEYWLAYHEACMSFYERLLQCDDITGEQRTEYQRMIQEHMNDKNNIINERNDRDGITSRNELLEQGLTDDINIENDKKVTGGTYQSLISMGLTLSLIQRYFNIPSADIPKNQLESNIYTLKPNIEVISGSGAYITSVNELVELLKKYGIIK